MLSQPTPTQPPAQQENQSVDPATANSVRNKVRHNDTMNSGLGMMCNDFLCVNLRYLKRFHGLEQRLP